MHYVAPNFEERRELKEEIKISGKLNRLKVVIDKFEPVYVLVKKGEISEKWIEELEDKAPFSLKAVFIKIVEEENDKAKRTLRILNGEEIGTLAMEIVYNCKTEIGWSIRIEKLVRSQDNTLVVRLDVNVVTIFHYFKNRIDYDVRNSRLFFVLPKGTSRFLIYLVALPREVLVSRERMVLIPFSSRNEPENLKLASAFILSSDKYPALITYLDEEIDEDYEKHTIWNYIRKLLPNTISCSVIGARKVDENKKFVDEVSSFLKFQQCSLMKVTCHSFAKMN